MFRQMFEEKYMRFPQGRCKALTFSYDDGVSADKKLLKIFAEAGFKGTFNLNSKLFGCENWHGRMDEEQTISVFSDCGQEVAMHGARHIFMNRVPVAEAVNEVISNRAYLEEKFGRIVRGLAYPYDGRTEEIISLLPSLGVAYGRTTKSTHAFSIPENFLLWNPTCHHGDDKLLSLTEQFLAADPCGEFKNREPLLFYIWGHSYEFDDNGNWDIMRGLCKKLGGRDDIWYCTNIEFYDYVTAYKRLEFSLDGERVFNPSAMPVWLDIRGKTYKIDPAQVVTFGGEI